MTDVIRHAVFEMRARPLISIPQICRAMYAIEGCLQGTRQWELLGLVHVSENGLERIDIDGD